MIGKNIFSFFHSKLSFRLRMIISLEIMHGQTHVHTIDNENNFIFSTWVIVLKSVGEI